MRFNSFRTVQCHACAGRGVVVVTREAKITHALAVILLALVLSGCDFLRKHPEVIPDPLKACRAACELAGGDLATTSRCLLACDGQAPTPTVGTSTQLPTVSPTPNPSPTSAPAIETAIPIGGNCTDPENNRGPFMDDVEQPMREWLDANRDRWTPAGLGGLEYRLRDGATADAFVFAVVRALRDTGRFDVVAEATGGTPRVAISPRGDATFHAGYALVVGGSWDVRFPSRGSSYLGQCRPRGFEPSGNPGQLPTAAPTVTPVAQATCPPLWFITAATKGGRQQWEGVPGWLIDLTPRYLIDGKDKPCNREKFLNCGTAGGGVDAAGNQIPDSGDLCEPSVGSLEVVYQSQGYNAVLDGYAGRIVGPEGSPFSVTVRLRPNAVDKAGRPIDLSQFYPYVLRGAI